MVNTSRDKQRTWLIQVEITKEMVNTREINKEHG